ncbi:PRC-barrel domain-containing protein [Inquilinus limosus]|uniref:PRC-barrel domain-containing protein n=1 Tax=Inquilinus limosus TaxID=171674 RepID=UPI00041B1C89|nr:PRC-barrel domain-containing protein [Inquilinus limosus]
MRRLALGLVLLSAVAGTAVAQDKPRFVTPQSNDLLGSNLVGADVRNRGGETIGEIEDVIIANKSTIRGVVVSVGGFLGMDEHYVAIDPAALDLQREGDDWRVTLDATKDQLRAAPQVDYRGRR